jgi:hypothetical protein
VTAPANPRSEQEPQTPLACCVRDRWRELQQALASCFVFRPEVTDFTVNIYAGTWGVILSDWRRRGLQLLCGHCIVESGAAARSAQVAQTGCISQFSRNRCKRLELVLRRVGREEEQEYKIDWPTIDRFEIDRLVQTR